DEGARRAEAGSDPLLRGRPAQLEGMRRVDDGDHRAGVLTMTPVDVLSKVVLEAILAKIPGQTIGVLGDLYLDRYLDLDATLTEPSIETGLDAYQVVRVRPSPGAAGTVINNLIALGVRRVVPISVIGFDGEGRELTQALESLGRVDLGGVVERG